MKQTPHKQRLALISGLMMVCCASLSWAAEPVKTPTPKPINTKPPTTVANSESYYVKKIETTYGGFAGSSNNLQNLTQGLRNSTPITLTTVGPTGEVSIVTFDPPTKPMGYGNISRALDFASKELAIAGISNPTAEQLQAALMGGSVINNQGQLMNMQGVLQLRSDGMGWGQIAHHLNISPAASINAQHATLVKANGAADTAALEVASNAADRARDINGNAYGTERSGIVNGNGNGGGSIQTAAGSSGALAKGQLDKATGNERSSIVSAAGAGSGAATNGYALGHTKGIVNAGGASAGYGGIMHGDGSGFGGGAYAASAGASAMVGAGNGNGNAFGHAKGKD